ncbi:hypothetical protein DERP_001271 [Dermatophagoides pteronyssinus]|uniref:Carboxypeptidase Q n=1 Tax=Dermatophagoides pteronyssinus TaxID=6956 RepID=A0ABQ8JEI3_DERPT|nr:hypothetical protein DERP_001271 [Dermatophagoides pteronyssinus]
MRSYFFCIIWVVAVAATDSNPDATSIFNGEGCANDQLFQTRIRPQIQQLASNVQRIIDHVMSANESGRTYRQLAEFVDRFGSRLTGTKNLEDSIDYMIDLLKQEGHDNVHGEPVQVPKWTRGNEWARMIKPRDKKLNILGLGYSEGTNGQTIEAPIVVVRNFTELEQKAGLIPGKIVVYNFKYESYGKQAIYRHSGASRAAKFGAVAAMIRSLTPFSIDSPHTGMQSYDVNVTKIPAISITTEDADLFQRFSDRNEEVIVQIYSENHNEKDKGISRNTVSDVRGEKYPNEIVLVSGHIDSWDVGQGASDDGAGAFISWRALSVIKKLGLRPKRTLRSVLWTGEEFGLIGVYDYIKKHRNELKDYVIAMESDIGTFTPRGITYSGKNSTSQCTLWEILQLMHPINATTLTISTEGSDVQAFYENGVPISSLDTANDKYFYFHHTQGDTMTVEQPDDLDKCQALWTSVSYALAMLDDRLSR